MEDRDEKKPPVWGSMYTQSEHWRGDVQEVGGRVSRQKTPESRSRKLQSIIPCCELLTKHIISKKNESQNLKSFHFYFKC